MILVSLKFFFHIKPWVFELFSTGLIALARCLEIWAWTQLPLRASVIPLFC